MAMIMLMTSVDDPNAEKKAARKKRLMRVVWTLLAALAVYGMVWAYFFFKTALNA
jgi:type VI protein secretion system component VasF